MQKFHFKKGCFFNNQKESRITYLKDIADTFFTTLHKKIFSKKGKTFKPAVLDKSWYRCDKVLHKSIKPIITWIGQSTFLIQVDNVNILTDPMFGDLTFFYKRKSKPGVALCDLPKIDYILISHNHRDHMEEKALLFLKKFNPVILVPQGDKKWFHKRAFENVVELVWWQGQNFLATNGDIKFSFLPAHHWSSRDIWDMNKSLWGSWMIQIGNFSIYFGGDSAYNSHYTIIANKFLKIDVALMPIAPSESKKQNVHLGPEQACQAFLDLKAKNFIPMHWGTIGIGTDELDEPIIKLKKWWEQNEKNVQNKILHIPKLGQQLKL